MEIITFKEKSFDLPNTIILKCPFQNFAILQSMNIYKKSWT